MLLSLFLAAVFFLILFFFGWQLARFFLKENRIEHLLALTGIFGISFYIFFVNIFGHFLPINSAFYLVLLLFLVTSVSLSYFKGPGLYEWGIDKKWRKILLATVLLLIVANGIVYLRYPAVLHGPGGLPITATIAEGNFPPKEIWYPKNTLRYHYTMELFSAALYKTTGLPVYLGNDFQVAILIGILFLLAFCLAKRFFDDSNFKALIASFLTLYAGGLVFLRGFKGIPILYDLYVRHQQIANPFKFVTDSIITDLSVPPINNLIGFTWGTLTFTLIIAVIYLYFYLIKEQKSKMAVLFCGLLLAVLAITGEIFFAVLCLILFLYPFVSGLFKKDWPAAKKIFSVSFWILIIAVPLSFLQGGFLGAVLDGVGSRVAGLLGVEQNLFKINEVPWVLDYFQATGSPIFLGKFYLEWGLLFILLIFALAFLIKRNFQLGIFLATFSTIFFVIPIFLTYNFWAFVAEVFNYFVRLGEMFRFFWAVNLVGGMAIGLWLAHHYLATNKKWLKLAIIFVIVALTAQGLLFELLFLTVGYPAPSPLNASVQYYAKAGSFEGKAYNWVKENTRFNDLFLIAEKICDPGTTSQVPNYRFIINTGRLAPIWAYHCTYPNEPFDKIKESCSSSAISDLKYGYLYVDENWIPGLEQKCLANNKLELKFEENEGSKFVRIYKVL